jgi:hypothetical protein
LVQAQEETIVKIIPVKIKILFFIYNCINSNANIVRILFQTAKKRVYARKKSINENDIEMSGLLCLSGISKLVFLLLLVFNG